MMNATSNTIRVSKVEGRVYTPEGYSYEVEFTTHLGLEGIIGSCSVVLTNEEVQTLIHELLKAERGL